MDLIKVYKCLCDEQRLRILNLLQDGPLCVCHLMEVLDADQVKVSKQLRYMKDQGLLTSRRQSQWMLYALAEPTNPMLTENLKCLQDCNREYPVFTQDLKKRAAILKRIRAGKEAGPKQLCCS